MQQKKFATEGCSEALEVAALEVAALNPIYIHAEKGDLEQPAAEDTPGWKVFFRQLHDAYPDGFDPTDVIRDEGKFNFPVGVGGEKTGAPRWMWLSCDLKNRAGCILGGLKLTHERRNGVMIEGSLHNTLFWWKVVAVGGRQGGGGGV